MKRYVKNRAGGSAGGSQQQHKVHLLVGQLIIRIIKTKPGEVANVVGSTWFCGNTASPGRSSSRDSKRSNCFLRCLVAWCHSLHPSVGHSEGAKLCVSKQYICDEIVERQHTIKRACLVSRTFSLGVSNNSSPQSCRVGSGYVTMTEVQLAAGDEKSGRSFLLLRYYLPSHQLPP